jgi:hypothetical protein
MAAKREQREPIYDLEKKIVFLLKHLNLSLNWLDQKAGVSRSALRDVLDKDKRGYDKVSHPVQVALAKACGFRVDWEEWNDPQANQRTPHERQDTAERFAERYLRENPSRGSGQQAVPRRIDVLLKVIEPELRRRSGGDHPLHRARPIMLAIGPIIVEENFSISMKEEKMSIAAPSRSVVSIPIHGGFTMFMAMCGSGARTLGTTPMTAHQQMDRRGRRREE